MNDQQPLSQFITYGFKTYISKKIDLFSTKIKQDYQNFKNETKTYQMNLIMHLKDFNKIIADSVFMVFKLTEKKTGQKVFGKVANQLYGFYKQFKESETLKYFSQIQQLYLQLTILIYGSLLVHQRNKNFEDVKNYKIKIQNHLLCIFEKYIDKGFHKSDISYYLYYQILNQIPLSLLSYSFFEQLKLILKRVQFGELIEQIQQLKQEFQSFEQDPLIQQSLEKKKSFIEMNTQSGDRIKNKKKTVAKKSSSYVKQNDKIEIVKQKKNEVKKYILNYAKQQGLVDKNIDFDDGKNKFMNKKKVFILQKEDYHKINRNNFDNIFDNESSFQFSLGTGNCIQKQNIKRHKKIVKKKPKKLTCNQLAFSFLKSQKNIYLANNLCLMNIKGRINEKQKMHKRIQMLKKVTAKVKRKNENQQKQLTSSSNSSYSHKHSIISSQNFERQDKQQRIDEQNIDDKELNRNVQLLKDKFNLSLNCTEEDLNQKLSKINHLKNYYKKDQDTVLFRDNFSQQYSLKNITILNNKEQNNKLQNNFFEGFSDTKNPVESVDDAEQAKLMSQRISNLLKKEFKFSFTKEQFEIEQVNNKNMCNLSCTF